MKQYKLGYFLIFLLIVVAACSTTTSSLKFEPISYKNEYKIASAKNVTKRLNIKIALINIKSSDVNTQASNDQNGFKIPQEFIDNFMQSVEIILANKGYFVVDRFNNLSELTEEMKQNIDFLVLPTLSLYDVEDINIKSTLPLDIINTPDTPKGELKCSGTVIFKGQLNFTILDPLTNDIIYVKKNELKESSSLNVSVGKYMGLNTVEMTYKGLLERCSIAKENARNAILTKIYNSSIKIVEKKFPEGKTAKKLLEKVKTIHRFNPKN